MRYLILTYYHKATGQIDEAMTVTKNVKRRDLQTANLILDFKEQRIVLGSVQGKEVIRDWDTVVGYYYQYYANIIERLLIENGHPNPHIQQDSAAVDQKT